MNTRSLANLTLLSTVVFLAYKYICTKGELDLCSVSSEQYMKTLRSVQDELKDYQENGRDQLLASQNENRKLSSNLRMCETGLETANTKYFEVKELLRTKSDVIVGLNLAQDQAQENIKTLKEELINSVNTVESISKQFSDLKEENLELRAAARRPKKTVDIEGNHEKKIRRRKLVKQFDLDKEKDDLEDADVVVEAGLEAHDEKEVVPVREEESNRKLNPAEGEEKENPPIAENEEE